MRYCTLADLQREIPLQTLIELSNDDPMATAIDHDQIEGAVMSSEELVDAHLRGRYTLPLAEVPTVIKDATVTLTRHRLYMRRPEGNELPKAVVRAYDAMIRVLESIRDGRLTIGLAAGEAAPEPGEMKVRGRVRQFPESLLDRYS